VNRLEIWCGCSPSPALHQCLQHSRNLLSRPLVSKIHVISRLGEDTESNQTTRKHILQLWRSFNVIPQQHADTDCETTQRTKEGEIAGRMRGRRYGRAVQFIDKIGNIQLDERSGDVVQSVHHARGVEPQASRVAVVQKYHERQLREVRRVGQYARRGRTCRIQVNHTQHFDMLAWITVRTGQSI
jgi:hypothetical protein